MPRSRGHIISGHRLNQLGVLGVDHTERSGTLAVAAGRGRNGLPLPVT